MMKQQIPCFQSVSAVKLSIQLTINFVPMKFYFTTMLVFLSNFPTLHSLSQNLLLKHRSYSLPNQSHKSKSCNHYLQGYCLVSNLCEWFTQSVNTLKRIKCHIRLTWPVLLRGVANFSIIFLNLYRISSTQDRLHRISFLGWRPLRVVFDIYLVVWCI